ncbi:MAG: sensor histidine kinase [bacterium]
MRYNESKYKFILLYAFILALILIAYNCILYYSVRLFLIQDIDESLEIKAAEIAAILPEESIKGVSDDLQKLFNAFNKQKEYICIVDAQGKIIFKSLDIPRTLCALLHHNFSHALQKINFSTFKTQRSFFRAINYPFIKHEQTRFIVQVATPATTLFIILNKLQYISWITMIIIVVLTVLLMSLFTTDILAPLMFLRNFADHISQKDLTKRIPQIKGGKEIQSMVKAFNLMMERLDKSFTSMSDFTSYIAHELKTPLAIMRGELELALMQNKFNKAQQDIIGSFLEEIERMNTIIRDLHYLARIDYLPDLLALEKIDFKKYLTEIYEQSKVLASEKEIEVVIDSLDDEIMINADETHLRRLFFNIINNAIKYTKPKGKIAISAKKDQSKAYINISDTGIGIAQENLPRIFDKSFQVDKSRKAGDTGSGLGLTIALAIAKAHQGDITVTSTLKEGTAFTVILPLA